MDTGDQFADPSVVAAYAHRPPIPAAITQRLVELLPAAHPVVLDAGCGTGAIAAALAPFAVRVDAVDPSRAMIAEGRQRLVGVANVAWIEATAEKAALRPPYGLIVCAGSLHWMDLRIVLSRFARALAPDGLMAAAIQIETSQPWSAELHALTLQHSTNQDTHNYRLFHRLSTGGDFDVLGEFRCDPTPYAQTVESYLESIHSRSGCSRDRMSPTARAAFDREALDILRPHASAGLLHLQIFGQMVWGRPTL